MALEIQMPLFDADGDVPTAMVFDAETGMHYDDCWNLESAQTYIHQGSDFIILATGEDTDRGLTAEQVVSAINYEYALVEDCFGWRVPVLVP